MFRIRIFFFFLLIPLFSLAATETAIFASGCFWCGQADFDKVSGVVKTIVGYDGGDTPNPTYESVSAGEGNYAESVKVIFDPAQVTYSKLLDYFWHTTDPTVKNAQFCDHGRQYRSAIFYLNEKQKQEALASLQKIKKQLPVAYTEITSSTHFYPAEEYHQNYYKKNPIRYRIYRLNCGRDARLKEIWNAKH